MKGNGIPDVIQFRRMLRDRDLKATPQRMAVHEAMRNLVHASADDVALWIAERGSVRVAPASVYNILTLLSELGVYGRRCGQGGKMVFDVRAGRHVHLYDTRSEAWRDLEDPELLAQVEARLKGRRFRGYRIDGVDVQILCHPTKRRGPAGKA